MAKSRERGTGSVYLKDDPNNPGQKLQTWWISYYIDGKRKRESSKSRKKSDAQALLKRRMGEHALGLELGDEAKRLTFEDLEAGFRRSYENSGRRSLRRAGNAWDRLREHFGGWKARAITANALESYAAERLKEAAPATVQYELAVLRRAMTLAVRRASFAAGRTSRTSACITPAPASSLARRWRRSRRRSARSWGTSCGSRSGPAGARGSC